jgi:hypothetical protein
MRKRVAACTAAVAAGLTILAMAVPSAASAATSSRQAPRIGSNPYYKYRAVNKTFEGDFSGDWRVCGHGVNATGIKGVSFTCTETVTSTTTVTTTATYTAKEISTAIGFSIARAYTYSQALGLTVPLPAHKQANIDFGIYYAKYRAGIERQYCLAPSNECLPWSGPTYVIEQYAIAPAIGAFDEKAA